MLFKVRKRKNKSLKRKWMIRFKTKVCKVLSGVVVFDPRLFDTRDRSVILHVFFSTYSVHFCLFGIPLINVQE